jgi:hypothetical protein
MRRAKPPRLTASITHVTRESDVGLTDLADALLLLTCDAALDEALRIAPTFNISKIQCQSRHRVLEHAASTLREQLLVIEQQIHEAI